MYRAVGLFLVAGFAIITAPPLMAQQIPPGASGIYEAYAGGFNPVRAETAFFVDDDRYRIMIEAQTQGFVSWFFDWQGRWVSEGDILADGTLVPRRYRLNGDGDADEERARRQIMIDRDGQGRLERVSIVPDRQAENREAVPVGALAGSVDLMTALLATSLRIHRTGTCAGSFRIFDGRNVYDLLLEDAGRGAIEASRQSPFAADDAVKCKATARGFAGGSRDPAKRWDGEAVDKKQPFDVTVWFSRAGGVTLPQPHRVEIKSGYGTGFLHLDAVPSDASD